MKFKEIITGNITKKQLAWVFLPALFSIIIFWPIARALYPQDGGYYMDHYMISRQGNIIDNPTGGWFFIFSTTISGISIIFFMIYTYRRFEASWKPFAILFLFFGIIGGLGFIFVGISPEGNFDWMDRLHNVGSAMAFGGLGFAALISYVLMLILIIKKKPWPNIVQFCCLLILISNFISMFFFIEKSSVIQWTGFYTIFVWIVGMFLILPEDLPESVIKKMD